MPLALARRALLAGLGTIAFAGAAAGEVLVMAAASLAPALDRVAEAWSATQGVPVVISYAGSPALARQIQQGAPGDIFVSASPAWMDALEASGDLRPGTRRDILGNRLVLIAHGRDAAPVTIDAGLDLVGLLDGGRLSMALVDAVPAGVYGKAALGTLGLWDAVAPHVAQSDNVRTALAFVAWNEAPLGIVYATDAAISDNVTVIGTFPADTHPPILYPAALTASSTHPAAADLLDFLTAPDAAGIWRAAGFILPDR